MSHPINPDAPVVPFAELVGSLDLSLFNVVPSQSSDGDRKAWLTVQRAVRQVLGGYVYLEIGSHLGGSIQQHIADPACRRIYSIDTRPFAVPDDRGAGFDYAGNSTARMIENLRQVPAADLGKLICFERGTDGIEPTEIAEPPNLCFIDGEHTHNAVLRDTEFCLRVGAPSVAVMFHDVDVTLPAIAELHRRLHGSGVPFRSWRMTGSTFLIERGEGPIEADQFVTRHHTDGRVYLRRRRAVEAVKRVTPPWLLALVRSARGHQ